MPVFHALQAGQLSSGLCLAPGLTIERSGLSTLQRYGEGLLSEVERGPQPLSSVMGGRVQDQLHQKAFLRLWPMRSPAWK
jgi:hypothetical protein